MNSTLDSENDTTYWEGNEEFIALARSAQLLEYTALSAPGLTSQDTGNNQHREDPNQDYTNPTDDGWPHLGMPG